MSDPTAEDVEAANRAIADGIDLAMHLINYTRALRFDNPTSMWGFVLAYASFGHALKASPEFLHQGLDMAMQVIRKANP